MLFFGQCIPHGLQRFIQCGLLVLVQGDALVGQAGGLPQGGVQPVSAAKGENCAARSARAIGACFCET